VVVQLYYVLHCYHRNLRAIVKLILFQHRDVMDFSVVMKESGLEVLPKELIFVGLIEYRFGVFLEGLKLTKERGFYSVELCVDSNVVFHVTHSIESKDHVYGSCWRLDERIVQLKQLDWEIKVSYNYSEANNWVDAIAKMEIGSDIRTTFYEFCPKDVKQFYFANFVEVTTLRLVLLSPSVFMFRLTCIPKKIYEELNKCLCYR